MRSHRDDISADPNMDSHPYDNFLDALAEFTSKNQSKYDQLLQQSQENCQTFQIKDSRTGRFNKINQSDLGFGNFEKTENLKEYKSQRYVEPDPDSSDDETSGRIHRSLDPKDEEKENKPNFAIFKEIFTNQNPFLVILSFLVHFPWHLKNYLLDLIDFYLIDPLIMIELRSKDRERKMFRYGKYKINFKGGSTV